MRGERSSADFINLAIGLGAGQGQHLDGGFVFEGV
jgi:hypothetical protein